MIPKFPRAAASYESFRRWIFSSARPSVRVAEPRDSSEGELEIQARWFGGEFGRDFVGVDGERIEIVQFGHWNHAAGPDFTEAAVKIDGRLLAGPIELDLDVRDWESHGHGVNAAFEETVLHVFTDGPSWNRFYTKSSSHRRICQLQLPQYAWSQGPPDFLPEAFPGRCLSPLSRMTDPEVDSLLLSAAQYRLQNKAGRFRVMAGVTSREQALFQGVAEALGFRSNKTAMAILAQRCPVEELSAMSPIDSEARLFGVAGFLDHELVAERASADGKVYLRELWDRWWKVRGDVEPLRSRAIPWCFSGNRPLNHPQRRVGALAAIAAHWELISPLWEKEVNNLERNVNNSLKNLNHPFWENHYTLQADPASGRVRLLGRDRLRDLLGNVVFPGAIGMAGEAGCTGQEELLWSQYLALRNVDSNQKLRRAGLRLFGPDEKRRKLFTAYYHQQQGLLQIYEDFCLEDVSDCEHCPFPEQLLQWQDIDRRSGASRGRSEAVSLQ